MVFLCDNYPISSGEFFIDDEMRVIADRFEKIYVLIPEQECKSLMRFIPENMEVVRYDSSISLLDKLRAILSIFTPMFVKELLRALFRYKIGLSVMLLKIMFMDLVRSNLIIWSLKQLNVDKQIRENETVFYSYWHDYKALALARFAIKSNGLFIARAHGWDVFAQRQNPPYLPFKKFIIDNLDMSLSISDAGKRELIKYTEQNKDEKIKVSRLGKLNSRISIVEKDNNRFLICSCSNIIPLKRIHLIIDLISHLKIEKIKWVHFGEGPLRNEMERYAKEKLPDVDFCFKGVIPNAEILDYYEHNYVDLFVNLSESEGIPVSIMEALSAGIPVLATDVGGTSEAVNEQVGFLLQKDFRIEEAVQIVTDYLKLPKEIQMQFRLNAHHFWQENYEAQKNYGAFMDEVFKLRH